MRRAAIVVLVALVAGVVVAACVPSSPSPVPVRGTPLAASPTALAPSPPSATPAAAAPIARPGTCAYRGALPDPACTPGAADPRVTQATIHQTICAPGYTQTVRPPVEVTTRIKRERMAAYGLVGRPLADYELDHLIPLELGGAPADPANLWPEPWTGGGNAHDKDDVENRLHADVCAGRMPLAEAQRAIAADWTAARR